jgi:hypothetical protein
MASQVHPGRAPIQTTNRFACLSIQASSSPSKRKTPLDVAFFPRDDESTQGDDEDSGDDRLIAQTLQSALSPPTKDLIIDAVNKAAVLQKNILDLHRLLLDLRFRYAALSQSTYKCEWPGSWPLELLQPYAVYKKDDSIWRDLKKQLKTHRSTYGTVRPGSPGFTERRDILVELRDAAVR